MVVGSDRFWHGHERLFHDNVALPTTFTYGEGRYLVAKLCARHVFHVVDHDDRYDDPERDPHDPALWPCLSPRAAPTTSRTFHGRSAKRSDSAPTIWFDKQVALWMNPAASFEILPSI